MTSLETKTLKNGIHVRVYKAPSSAAPSVPCLFIHGFTQTAFSFHECMSQVQKTRDCFGIDLAGHGKSLWREEYTRDSFLQDIQSTVDLLGLDKFVLVGLSMGASLSCAFTATPFGQAHVVKLVLIDWYVLWCSE